jgi:hypothetical protein
VSSIWQPVRYPERRMLAPLLTWLFQRRRLNEESTVALELSWLGRRVDLATVTKSGASTAYEMKVGRFGRVLEQAIYNRAAFDRSFMVVDAAPKPQNLQVAADAGVGVIVVQAMSVQLVRESPRLEVEPGVRRRIHAAMARGGYRASDV